MGISAFAFAYEYIGSYIGDRQCVAVANQWLGQGLGLPPVYRNAVDWVAANIANLRWVQNGPTNAPAAGDLVVWHAFGGHGIGPFGHIALALAGDAMHFLSLDQNWPPGAPCTAMPHDYLGVAGWLTR